MNDFVIARFVFVKLLALCTLIAFASLLAQLDGLYASGGILPIAATIEAMRARAGDALATLVQFPTLFVFGASDVQIHLACWIGVGVSVLALIGFATIPCFVIAWALYLSFVTAGLDFLSFQWDFLLLQSLALGALVAPARNRPSRCADVAVSRIGLLPLWCLLFQLMFASGVVKYRSTDGAWRHLEALRYHFETQPLPTVVGWWAHQLPQWAKTAGCAATLFIEIVVPFAIFAPRPMRALRRAAAWTFIAFMVVIGVTGNYTFFNLLTIALATLLLDDGAWPSALRRRLAPVVPSAPSRARLALLPIACTSIAVSIALSIGAFRPGREPWPEPVAAVEAKIARFGLASRFGLFEDMTEERPEILVEGSDDGVAWKTFEFRWKPGDVARAPRFVAPHQPRLDWQMWFAALGGDARRERWFLEFARRLLQGAPAVVDLLANDPFAGRAPRYLRARMFRYRFTTTAERAESGAWWRREELPDFLPAVELAAGSLRIAGLPH